MKLHILGIAGKLMSGIALMAKQMGHTVSGSDANLESPMARQLKAQDITLFEGYEPSHLDVKPDMVIVGNVMSRGNPLIEALLNTKIPYCSAPEWLAREVFQDKWVLAVSGTHGKTTTASMVAWILEHAGYNPGFLIGGNPVNFEVSSRLSGSSFFVIEADEYDSAFFDKRPKFIHYHPNTLVINNLEFDHADIYQDLAAIQKQFHYLVRTVPGLGSVIVPSDDGHVSAVLERGLWTPTQSFGPAGDWGFEAVESDYSHFKVIHQGELVGGLTWALMGEHNARNALAALAACYHVGVRPTDGIAALEQFQGVERRMQKIGELNGAVVFDDFAHHPSAVKTTLDGMRHRFGDDAKIYVILEFGSYTMRHGVHGNDFSDSLSDADYVYLLSENVDFNINDMEGKLNVQHEFCSELPQISKSLKNKLNKGDYLVIMSNQDSMAITQAIGL